MVWEVHSVKGIGGILGGIWALRPDLNLLRRYKENYGEVEGDHRLEIIRGGVEELRHWILPYMLDASLNAGCFLECWIWSFRGYFSSNPSEKQFIAFYEVL